MGATAVGFGTGKKTPPGIEALEEDAAGDEVFADETGAELTWDAGAELTWDAGEEGPAAVPPFLSPHAGASSKEPRASCLSTEVPGLGKTRLMFSFVTQSFEVLATYMLGSEL